MSYVLQSPPRRIPALLLVFMISPVVAGRAQAQTIPWAWSVVPNHYPLVDLTAGGPRHNAYVLHEGPRSRRTLSSHAELRYELQKGAVRHIVWRQKIQAHQGMPRAAMVVSGPRIFVARHSLIATTCTLYAFARQTGKPLWQVTLKGVGPVVHSRYFNRVQLRVLRGNPVVFGYEIGTSYIEMRDAATGTLRSHRKFRHPRPKEPLAERLFDELHRVLRQRRTYRRSVSAFIAGHVIKMGAPALALAAFRLAVKQVDGLPLRHNHYRLSVRLVEKKNGTHVIVARRRSSLRATSTQRSQPRGD
ncbi:MAG: hypothetical protein JRH20_32075 [Deltaproteobacteria bacterium]|nr:hypothetical protein [Deltaproteobacteria bacterium]